MQSAGGSIEKLSKRNISALLADKMIDLIEQSGAAQTEVLAALGVVQSLLPTLGISLVSEEDARSG
jgi:hypothetical protein